MYAVDYLIVDGSNLAFRCFYGVKHLSNDQQLPVNAIYGFLNSLLSIQQIIRFEHLVVCFDCGRSVRRVQLLKEYKANRRATPEEFKVQLPYIKRLIALMGGVYCEIQGVEADDIMGALCDFITHDNKLGVVVSADKDLMQCVNDNIAQLVPSTQGWNLLKKEDVFEKMKVWPAQIVDFLTLVGDSADNYPGIPGVGPKTAAKWLGMYETLDGIYAHRTTLSPERFRGILNDCKELIDTNKRLASLDRNFSYAAEVLAKISVAQRDQEALLETLSELRLNRLVAKFKEKSCEQTELF